MDHVTASWARQMSDDKNGFDDLLAGALKSIAHYAAGGAYTASVRRDPTDRAKSRALLRALRSRGFKAKFSLSRWIDVRWDHATPRGR